MLTFAAAVFLLVITPGPGVLSAAGVGAAYGMKSGARYVLGLFLGQSIVIVMVVTGLTALILANPAIRWMLLGLTTVYLLYLAARIAFAGSQISFIEARTEPGIMTGLLLQPINPKAYAVNTTLFTGFPLFGDALMIEFLVKLLILKAMWVPIHMGWVWAGVQLHQMNLPERTQRRINFAMAASMLIVVALAAFSNT